MPSLSEHLLQAVVNELPYGELQDLLQDLIHDGIIEFEHLKDFRESYPSICPAEIYQALLPHFEE